MKKVKKISVVTNAHDEYSKAVGMGATTSSSSGGGQNYGLIASSAASTLATSPVGGVSIPGAGAAPGDGTNLAYAERLEMERAFQSERLEIIKSANFEEFSVMGNHSDEQVSKEKENNEIRKGNTKALIGASLSLMSTLMSGANKNNKAMFEVQKAYSIGTAMMDAYSSAGKVYARYAANPPLAGLMSAMALAKGVALARSIASQKMTRSVGSGGGGVIGGGSHRATGGSTVPYGASGESEYKGTQNIVVNIHNPLSDENWAKIVEDNIIPAIEGAGKRNVLLDVNV